MKRKTVVILAVGLLILGAGLALPWILSETEEHGEYNNFFEVTPGVLYRSGMLKPREMEDAFARFKFKTIVNLREDEAFKRRGMSEEQWAKEHGVRYLLLLSHETVRAQEVVQFLKVVADPNSQPVLVHCHQGRSRTGVFVAAYRVCIQGWSVAQAAKEMMEFRCAPDVCEANTPLLQQLKLSDWRELARLYAAEDAQRQE
jgi:protein tyrosine/serine phosphatase